MLLVYRLGLRLYLLVLHFASLFSPKAKEFLGGRLRQQSILDDLASRKEERIWFHFASLGEFEQGRPVLELWRVRFPSYKVVMTFFSPSGYQNRKDYPGADYVLYLPMDGKKRSLRVVKAIGARYVVFTKYDFWYYYFLYCRQKGSQLFVISAIFRPSQVFFKPWGGLFRRMLGFTSWIFVQDQASVALLNGIGIIKVSVCGDTRFDRVLELAASPKAYPLISAFCGSSKIFIAGSTWLKDEDLLLDLITSEAAAAYRFILAPHENDRVSRPDFLKTYAGKITWICYSQLAENADTTAFRLLVIDNIGMLSSLYDYTSIAYIGGGFGSGIHNILEAGATGIPVLIGPNYTRFREANEMVAAGGALVVSDSSSLLHAFQLLNTGDEILKRGKVFKSFIKAEAGASSKILQKIIRLNPIP